MNYKNIASIGLSAAGGIASIGIPIGSLVESDKQNRNFGSGAGHLMGASIAGGAIGAGSMIGAYALSRKDIIGALAGFNPEHVASAIAKGIK